MPCVADLLAGKPDGVITIPSSASVLDAVRRMHQHRIGALVVTRHDADSTDGDSRSDRMLGFGDSGFGGSASPIVGMFTERDVLRLVAALQDVCHLNVGTVMTRDIVTVSADTDIEEAQEIMRSRRVRHLPVVEGGYQLVGIISLGDINAWCLEHTTRQLQGLSEYIHGRA